ncbi:MAG: hypothetical protein JHC54_12495 [Acinetobacter sp.]|nr:hypothetical protein [Acinetobacter sp.]
MTEFRLSTSQKTAIERVRNPGGSEMGVRLSDDMFIFLAVTIARDLERRDLFPSIKWDELPAFFDADFDFLINGLKEDYTAILARLFNSVKDSDAYLMCLATLHKSRLKYAQILCRQPMPTFDQVGPRGLLQFGRLSSKSIIGLLYWRKWLFDLDNRAAQETGYLFEPILAHAIGGTPHSASKSPVKRTRDAKKGRQVDCIRDKFAYEFKLRVTTAASGQGRWGEELDFPVDCKNSGYTPILLVLDPTTNSKLVELESVFKANGGQVFIGDSAWQHLEDVAGPVMSIFLNLYVRRPLIQLIEHAEDPIEKLQLTVYGGNVSISIGEETMTILRENVTENNEVYDMPSDVDEDLPGM